MKLLAIETATDACSVALRVDGGCIVRHAVAPRRHAELLIGQIESLLDEAGFGLGALDVLAFGRGPGSFTGLRIASGVVQGLATGAGLGVVPVSSLRAVAQGAVEEGATGALVAFDARMGEVYFGGFTCPASDAGAGPALMAESIAERVCAPGALECTETAEPREWVGLGEGWAAYRETLDACFGDRLVMVDGGRLPHARDVARIAEAEFRAGGAVAPRDAVPVYLRDRVTHGRPPAPRPAG